MNLAIDHLVIGAATLEQGAAYVKAQLGVDIPFGGVHETMGTHNHLMALSDHLFLEVIAMNPSIEAPPLPRWYGLDDPYVQHRLKQQAGLIAWVVNTNNIRNSLQKASCSFGHVQRICRGELSWDFALPSDGRLLGAGMLPYLIEWQTAAHPARNMHTSRCRLKVLEIHHPNINWLASVLSSIGAQDLVEICSLNEDETPYLAAHIETPLGLKVLRSCV